MKNWFGFALSFLFSASAFLETEITVEDMMKKYEQAAMPGKEHKLIHELVGKWKVKTKMWLDPAGPAQESEGEAELRSVLGGRFIEETTKSVVFGQPFEGRSLMGYDNLAKQFVSTWSDSTATSISMMKGTYNESTKTIVMSGEYIDVVDMKTKTMKMEAYLASKDKTVYTFWNEAADKKPYKSMEMVYTRVK